MKELQIWFRLFGLSPKEISLLKNTVSIAKDSSVRKHFKDPKISFVSLQLNRGQNYDDLCHFLKEKKIKESSYDFYVSLVTSRDHDGVSVPKYVLDLHRKIGGRLEFSFVYG